VVLSKELLPLYLYPGSPLCQGVVLSKELLPLYLYLGSPLCEGVVLRKELLPLVLPELGWGTVQVQVLPHSDVLLTPFITERFMKEIFFILKLILESIYTRGYLEMLKSIRVLRTRPLLASTLWQP